MASWLQRISTYEVERDTLLGNNPVLVMWSQQLTVRRRGKREGNRRGGEEEGEKEGGREEERGRE